ncbi:hypothetical protein [Streptomonospora wellingtoniae]|uniref:Uncharacterized protein n=1 Tax=Streptomonospora wellingtoniae TaxID=3075544 RepID=A0ABU2KY26_9ACTN|nr:hypothetical protein [Streptomonospora sp. DSM 45055]MDT0304209.1 hypothetical protein [Streptomonospora sp. DSM 45055]
MNDSVALLAERIATFNFPEEKSRQKSQLSLLHEYLRRFSFWVGAYSDLDWPAGDAAAMVNPGVRAAPELVAKIKDAIPVYEPPVVEETCLNALHFEALRSAGQVTANLPCPYDPLLLMYERGHGFKISQGYFEVGTSGIKKGRPRDFRAADPIVPLDAETLAAIDRGETL